MLVKFTNRYKDAWKTGRYWWQHTKGHTTTHCLWEQRPWLRPPQPLQPSCYYLPVQTPHRPIFSRPATNVPQMPMSSYLSPYVSNPSHSSFPFNNILNAGSSSTVAHQQKPNPFMYPWQSSSFSNLSRTLSLIGRQNWVLDWEISLKIRILWKIIGTRFSFAENEVSLSQTYNKFRLWLPLMLVI